MEWLVDGFPARWDCGMWSLALGWLHILSDVAIFGAYMAIPWLIWSALERLRAEHPAAAESLRKPASAAVLFVGFCGVAHLLEALTFWVPLYRLSGPWKGLTALVSVYAVVVFAKLLPAALSLRSAEHFESQLADRTESLQRDKDRAVDVQRAIQKRVGVVAAIFAHDLRQPVRAVRNLVGMVQHRGDRMDPGQRDELLLKVHDRADVALRMLDELHDYSLLLSGQEEGPASKITVLDFLTYLETLEAAHPDRERMRLSLETTYATRHPPSLPVITSSIRRVVDNLVDNSVKYRQGDVATIHVRCVIGNDRMAVQVDDDGMGFDPEVADLIFNPFHQLRPHQHKAEGGMGMGLAICKEIVVRYGGQIEASSPGEGQGASVRFDIPLSKPEVADAMG